MNKQFILLLLLAFAISAASAQKAKKAHQSNTSTISIKIYPSENSKAEKEVTIHWHNEKPATGGSNDAAIKKVEDTFKESGLDCPPEWTDLGNDKVKCGNGKIIEITGASASFKAVFSVK